MNDCTCGKPVRLRGYRLTVNRKRGVGHYIEHTDGTKACPEGDWTCVALKPYGPESQRPYNQLLMRWDVATRQQS